MQGNSLANKTDIEFMNETASFVLLILMIPYHTETGRVAPHIIQCYRCLLLPGGSCLAQLLLYSVCTL